MSQFGYKEDLKMRCLELALEHEFASPLDAAQNFYDFILGTNDAEIIRAARKLSEVVNAKA